MLWLALLGDPVRLARMGRNALKIGRPDAASAIVRDVLARAGGCNPS